MDEMRRLIALLVVALVGATVFGLSSGSSGLGVNGTRVSGNTFRSELATISTTPILQCYLTALDPVDFGTGGGNGTMAASGAAAWTNLRIEGLSITQYVKRHLKFVATPAVLAQAQTSLESELTQAASAATSKDGACPGTAAAALAAMPAEMRRAEIEGQAASIYLVSKLNSTIPLTSSALEAFYTSHRSEYDTLCVSIAVVPLSQIKAFATAQSGGASVVTLVKRFSIDTSKTKGGAAGCFAPSNTSYASVRTDVGATALNSFDTTPQYINDNGTEEALYVSPTKRTVTPFAQAETAVAADVQSQNASAANTEEERILYQGAIAVDPAFGQWVLESTGPTVLVPSLPAKVDVTGNKSLTTSVTTYF